MKSCQCIKLHSGPDQVFFFCEKCRNHKKCFQNKGLFFLTSAGGGGGEKRGGGGFLGTFFGGGYQFYCSFGGI